MRVNLVCETCKTQFPVYPCRIRQAERSNCKIRFCSNACRKRDGTNNPFWGKTHSSETMMKIVSHPNYKSNLIGSGRENPNIKRFGHSCGYKTIKKLLRQTVFMCQMCGWSKEPGILEIHHLDHNPLNNVATNVKLICPNCHSLEHFRMRTGKFLRLGKKKHEYVKEFKRGNG